MKLLFGASILVIAALYSVSSDKTLVRHKRWEDFPNVTMNFDCTDRIPGFYADVENDCKIFYICQKLRLDEMIRVPMFCQPPTMFDQSRLICNWPQNFNCADAPAYFSKNIIEYPPYPPVENSV